MQKNGVTTSISTKHHSITCMKEYESKSFEELRFEDYSCNRKGPQQQTGFGAAPFGASTSGSSTSLFGQTDNKQGFGQPQAFGQTPAFGQTTPAFGVTNQTNTPNLFGKPNTFGATTSTTPAFGFNQTQSTSNPFSATQTQKPFSQPLFGTTTTQAQPSFGTGVFGQTNTQVSGSSRLVAIEKDFPEHWYEFVSKAGAADDWIQYGPTRVLLQSGRYHTSFEFVPSVQTQHGIWDIRAN